MFPVRTSERNSRDFFNIRVKRRYQLQVFALFLVLDYIFVVRDRSAVFQLRTSCPELQPYHCNKSYTSLIRTSRLGENIVDVNVIVSFLDVMTYHK